MLNCEHTDVVMLLETLLAVGSAIMNYVLSALASRPAAENVTPQVCSLPF